MAKRKLGLVAVLVAAVAALVVPTGASAAYYPTSGFLYYDGYTFADSNLLWNQSGPWTYAGPLTYSTYQHDLTVRKDYFSSCTTWSNLPHPYDDCPPAGVSEPDPNYVTLSFGTWRAPDILANT